MGEDDLRKPTPCAEYDVSAVADHLVDTIARLAAVVGAQASTPEGATAEERRILHATQIALTAWRRRGLCGHVSLGDRTLPTPLALGLLSLELLVHGWDFAVATRHPLEVSDAHADFVLHLAHQTLTPQSRISTGFNDPVPVPSGSRALDELVAFTGRDPGEWDRMERIVR